MQIPTEITFHGLDASESVEAAIERWVARIEHIHDRIEGCSVVVRKPHNRHRHGAEFEVTVRIDLPGPNITVSHVGDADIYVMIADAFRAARRQVLERLAVQRGAVKTHVVERTGSIGVNVEKHRAGA